MDQDDERAKERESEQDRAAARHPVAGKGGSGGATLAVGGFEFAAVLLASVFLGQWLDRRLGTAPVFLLVCVFVGFAGATFSMYRRLTASQAREDEARRARNESSPK